MAAHSDTLIRFLIPDAQCRGAIIRGTHIIEDGAKAHGLSDMPAQIFGQTLLSSILLLSVSKGGIRQILQLDTHPTQAHSPITRILAEARAGAVRGYLNWQEDHVGHRNEQQADISSWMGSPLHLSTVRDLGFGQPYISTIEHDSEYLADHILHYLNQSVQVQADVILQGDLAILLEAMPGSDDDTWFKAIEKLASINTDTLESSTPEEIITAFDDLHVKIVGRDDYAYQCSCNIEKMAASLSALDEQELEDLKDENGHITLSCQYCSSNYTL